jgi:hypothetical protein
MWRSGVLNDTGKIGGGFALSDSIVSARSKARVSLPDRGGPLKHTIYMRSP